jgi:type III pantothenate kinase
MGKTAAVVVDPSPTKIAVDLGNSRMKIGRFAPAPSAESALPVPFDIFDLPIANPTGEFDVARFNAWCDKQVTAPATWLIASVHRAATERLRAEVMKRARDPASACSVQQITYREVPLDIRVDEPQRVGIDRLLGALAANRLRRSDQAAVIVDLGTAITVDLLDDSGVFVGGAILPGMAMSARALAEQTDALPLVPCDEFPRSPTPLGKSTVSAIQSGVFWSAVGGIREVASRLSTGYAVPIEMFVTGGTSRHVAEQLSASTGWSVRHVPHLVLSGIALTQQDASPTLAGGA